jgi:glycerol 2-dehydrogenase (NADP+)
MRAVRYVEFASELGRVRRVIAMARTAQSIADTCQTVPAVNQIEVHPANPSPKLLAYCATKGIHVSAYSPLGSTNSPLSSNDSLLSIAKGKGKSPQQVLLAWGLQQGLSILPKSVTKERIESNWELDGWDLTDAEMKELSSIKDRFKVCGDGWLPGKVFYGDDE